MNDHRSHRESIAVRLLAGDLDPGSEEARGVLAAEPDLARELAELQALGDRLDAVGRLRRAVQREASGEPRVHVDVGLTLRDAARGRGRRAARSARRRWTAAAAAAIVLASSWLVLSSSPGAGEAVPASNVVEVAFRALHPVGEVADYAPLEWSRAGESRGWYLVRVFGADDAPGAAPIADSRRLDEPRWQPVTDAWPDSIRWEVDAHGPRGEYLGTCRARATRIDGALR